MSDPASDGYTCHGPMRSIQIRGLSDGVCLWYCAICWLVSRGKIGGAFKC